MVFLRLDPTLPVVWRAPHEIQIGADSPRIVLEAVAERDERMLAAVRSGVPSEGLAAIGGCSTGEAAAFHDRIRPVLLGAAPAPRPAAALVRVRSAARDELVRTARMLGLVAASPSARPRVGLILADHVVPPNAYRDWVRLGVAHFAVVYGTRSATVGPLVVPGATGCLRCADLHRCDADPAWPVVAGQLTALAAASTSEPIGRTEALCAAARLVAEITAELADDVGMPVGVPRRVPGAPPPIEPHPDCGCMLDLQRPLPVAS